MMRDSGKRGARAFGAGSFVAVLAGLVTAGCLAPAPDVPRNWTVVPRAEKVLRAATPSFGTVRFATITVRAPYDRCPIAVWREDGSIAFDGFNVFAAPPAAILKGVAGDILSDSGLFRYVVPSHSNAAADVTAEISVRELALDCRAAGKREAVVTCSLRLIDRREVIACTMGTGRAPAAAGNYAEAFSSAFTAALANALADVKKASPVK